MGPLLLFVFFSSSAIAITVSGTGAPTFWPFLRSAEKAYRLIDPSFSITFDSVPSGAVAVRNMAGGNKSIDFALIDGFKPNATQYQAGLQIFPFLMNSIAAQVNLANNKDIVLHRSVLVDIFMGLVTNWNDSAITSTNPGVDFPNASIEVYYRGDVSTINTFLGNGFSSFSQTWKSTYPISQSFPSTLRALPHFTSYSNAISMNGALSSRQNTIGYVAYYMIARDPSLHYASLIHKYTNQSVPCSGETLEAASEKAVLNELLDANYSIDSENPKAWPLGNFIFLMVPTNPTHCSQARAFYKFIRWTLTDRIPRDMVRTAGCGPLTSNLTRVVIQRLGAIQCDGKPLGEYTDLYSNGWEESLFWTVAILVLFLGLIFSAVHIYHFSASHINLIYSIVFVLGTTLTLISPIFWFFPPNNQLCLIRIWSGSLGFAILLATMFSRTWQLNDIYQLQKAKRSMDALRYRVTTNKTLIQLATTLFGVIVTDIVILLIWSTADPLKSTFVVVDSVELTGYYTCTSNQVGIWLVLELIFFLSLLCFGVYVIYKTWSFQRQALLVETRWVLLALYNVILNICAVVPILSFVNVTERALALIVIISIDLSGGSIICAVLLPRLIHKLSDSTADSSQKHTLSAGSSGKRADNSIKSPTGGQTVKRRVEVSRTPEDELAKRLEEPVPLSQRREGRAKSEDTNIELQPVVAKPRASNASTEMSTSNYEDRSPRPATHQSMEILEEESEAPVVKKTTPRISFPRSINPLRKPEVSSTETELLRSLDESSGGNTDLYVS